MEPIKYENRLKECRHIAGLKQSHVVELLGLASANRLSRWEAGLAEPNLKNLLQLSRIYNMDVELLYPIDDGYKPRYDYVRRCSCGNSPSSNKIGRVFERRDGSINIAVTGRSGRITNDPWTKQKKLETTSSSESE